MPYKICPLCNKASYSSSEHGIWICPFCKFDLKDVQAIINLESVTKEEN